MKIISLITLAILFANFSAEGAPPSSSSVQADLFQMNRSRAQISFEGLGTVGLAGVYGSFWLSPPTPIVLNLGVGYTELGIAGRKGASAQAMTIPFSFSMLLGLYSHYFDFSAGGSASLVPASLKDTQLTSTTAGSSLGLSSATAQLGIGYRYWPQMGGLHFRTMGYLFANAAGLNPWGGLSLGYAF